MKSERMIYEIQSITKQMCEMNTERKKDQMKYKTKVITFFFTVKLMSGKRV